MIVSLEDGTEVQIDEEDLHVLEQPGWRLYKVPKSDLRYVARYTTVNGKSRAELLHRVILDLHDRSTLADHRDRNGLNNCRSNLRSCTHQQNLRNQFRKPSGKASRFKGLYWHRRRRKWAARICVDGKRIALGLFVKEEDAARAYDQAAVTLFGEFARLNAA